MTGDRSFKAGDLAPDLPRGDGRLYEVLPRQLGPYVLLERIGEGGMGVVYRARQTKPERDVAIKMMRAISISPKNSRRFAREIAILARLKHAGIAQIHDAGTDFSEGIARPYLVMELLRGHSLRWHLADESLVLRDRIQLMIQICEAVDYAHQQGVVHCDLKPENVVVECTTDGMRARILDFGVSRLADGDHRHVTTTTDAGRVVGTLGYMSPELLEGRRDKCIDIYALGAMLYEMVTGELPVTAAGKSMAEVLREIREESPRRPAALNRDAEGDLDTIIMTAIDNDLRRRYASAGRLADDLRRYLEDRPILAREPSLVYIVGKFARRRRGLVVAGVIALAAIMIGGAMGWYGLYRANLALDALVLHSKFMAEKLVKGLDVIAGTREVRKNTLDHLETSMNEVLRERPNDPECLDILADTLMLRGNMIRDDGRTDEALPLRERSLEIRLGLLKRFPDDAELRGKLAIDWVLLGDLYNHDATREKAKDYYGRAMEIQRALVREHPDRVDWVDDLGWSHHRLASIALNEFRYADAEALLRREFEICQDLAKLAPDDRRPDAQLLEAHRISGILAQTLGDLSRCGKEWEMGLECARRSHRREPDRTTYLEQFAGAGFDCIEIALRKGDAETVARLVAEIEPACEKLERAEPEKNATRHLRIHLLRVRQQLASLEGDITTAARLADETIEVIQNDSATPGSAIEFMPSLLHLYHLRRGCAEKLGDQPMIDECTRQIQRLTRILGTRPGAQPMETLGECEALIASSPISDSTRREVELLIERALEGAGPLSPAVFRRAGVLLRQMGHDDRAKTCFQNAMALLPADSPSRREVEKDLRSLTRSVLASDSDPRK